MSKNGSYVLKALILSSMGALLGVFLLASISSEGESTYRLIREFGEEGVFVTLDLCSKGRSSYGFVMFSDDVPATRALSHRSLSGGRNMEFSYWVFPARDGHFAVRRQGRSTVVEQNAGTWGRSTNAEHCILILCSRESNIKVIEADNVLESISSRTTSVPEAILLSVTQQFLQNPEVPPKWRKTLKGVLREIVSGREAQADGKHADGEAE